MRKSILFTGFLGAVFLAAFPDVALACPSCYGVISDTEIGRGLQLSMLALIAVTAMIGTGVVLFFSNINKRAALLAATDLDNTAENNRPVC